jgi:hypothetical protein
MKNIETIFEHESDNGAKGELGIGADGTLYWNKKPVITEQKIKLQGWVNVAAIATALSTVIVAIFTALTYFSEIDKLEKYKELTSIQQYQIEALKKDLDEFSKSIETQKQHLDKYKLLIINGENKNSNQQTLNKTINPTGR